MIATPPRLAHSAKPTRAIVENSSAPVTTAALANRHHPTLRQTRPPTCEMQSFPTPNALDTIGQTPPSAFCYRPHRPPEYAASGHDIRHTAQRIHNFIAVKGHTIKRAPHKTLAKPAVD